MRPPIEGQNLMHAIWWIGPVERPSGLWSIGKQIGDQIAWGSHDIHPRIAQKAVNPFDSMFGRPGHLIRHRQMATDDG